MNPEQAIKDYLPMIISESKSYYKFPLHDRFCLDDLISEGMQAVWRSALKWKEGRGVTFGLYAKQNVNKALLAMKMKNSTKANLKKTVSTWIEDNDEDDMIHGELPCSLPNPEQILMNKEIYHRFNSAIDSLGKRKSNFDPSRERSRKTILLETMKGRSQSEIAKMLGVSKQRINVLTKESIEFVKCKLNE